MKSSKLQAMQKSMIENTKSNEEDVIAKQKKAEEKKQRPEPSPIYIVSYGGCGRSGGGCGRRGC